MKLSILIFDILGFFYFLYARILLCVVDLAEYNLLAEQNAPLASMNKSD